MSRILRRPMFRGGRVDSRGTGITSGLSYAKGGRVGLANGGVSTTGGFSSSPIYRGGERLLDYGIYPLLNPINQYLVNPIAGLFGYGDLIPRVETPYDNKFLAGEATFTDKYKKKYMPDPIVTDSAAIPKAIMQNQDKISQEELLKKQLENLNKPKPKEDPVDPTATIKENRELFAELLGAKKARGQDISDMLLSFAGKALKDDATVKSAFGEFAEAEATRPSRARKIDDTAAAMAINAYIAGEKSIADTKKALDLYEKKLSRASSAEDSKTITTRMNEDKGTQRSDLKKLIGNTAEYMEDNNIPGVPQQIKKEQAEDPGLLVEENVGAVFIDTDSKKVFIIIKDSNGNLKKDFLYSG